MTRDPTRVFLVDDHALLRHGLCQLIERQPRFTVVGQAGDAAGALAGVAETDPEVAIVDLSLPGSDGLELVERLHHGHPELLQLVLSMHDEVLYAERALQAGARGYVMKEAPPTAVLDALDRVSDGQVYLSGPMTERIVQRATSGHGGPAGRGLSALTDRELEVLRLLGEGRSTNEAADSLGLSPRTVESHRAHIKQKLALRHHAELMRFAVCWVEGMSSTDA